MEKGLTKNQVIEILTKSPHGKLSEYTEVGKAAHEGDPEFYAHLIAWNAHKGQVRDAKVALPVLALRGPASLVDNALAHLALLDPRSLVKALDYGREVKAPSQLMRRLVTRYLRDREQDWRRWEGTTLQHRQSMKTLYARYHVARPSKFGAVLFEGERGGPKAVPFGKFAVLKSLRSLSPEEIAGAIAVHKIPFLVARGALGKRVQDPDVLLALITRMSATELVTNAKALERLGVQKVPALRAALEAGLAKVSTSTRAATLKTSTAAEALETSGDEELAEKFHAAQERQLDAMKGIEGNWLVLADKSGSMRVAIEYGVHAAAVLTRLVKGRVYLVFFDSAPRAIDATGRTLEELKKACEFIRAEGSTSIGCGLQLALDKKWEVNGIAVISDGGENQMPVFSAVYKRYTSILGIEPTVYFYHVRGDTNVLTRNCQMDRVDVTQFELGASVDYYSLPNLVQTMRTGRYGLLDEIYATSLLTLDQVLGRTKGMEVYSRVAATQAV